MAKKSKLRSKRKPSQKRTKKKQSGGLQFWKMRGNQSFYHSAYNRFRKGDKR